mmetsp:Transcript_30316/g.33871  ORF Transcript_30316/g.33871 Transcript_30316/m.33871 type:complete len:186 (-) Transcript_30316:134-691(-)|eukprot:CAMPEP_0168531976 /NCGR_PEP_ID=MMETSP0405-20121227/15872_1 /TAXON_ID=498012 /ORGANISM="Trichosphaerium sp, Strain Am-I-7 wt" /LENGTH=185 /DNA_ID=CAMNT_0008557089 /DNA_START=27 /DNA_END=584 /DNA_ORIENTATION=-
MNKENMQQVMNQQILKAGIELEKQLDAQLDTLNNLTADDMDALRQKRLRQMKLQYKQKQSWLAQGHGEYSRVDDQRAFFDACKKSRRVLCHFSRSSTERCRIVDKHMAILAEKHIEARFIYIDVEKAPFLVTKLKVWMLPSVIFFKDAILEDRMEGFDKFGGIDEFTTEDMENYLVGSGALINRK